MNLEWCRGSVAGNKNVDVEGIRNQEEMGGGCGALERYAFYKWFNGFLVTFVNSYASWTQRNKRILNKTCEN